MSKDYYLSMLQNMADAALPVSEDQAVPRIIIYFSSVVNSETCTRNLGIRFTRLMYSYAGFGQPLAATDIDIVPLSCQRVRACGYQPGVDSVSCDLAIILWFYSECGAGPKLPNVYTRLHDPISIIVLADFAAR